jgi:trimeric autotransporter adhesin
MKRLPLLLLLLAGVTIAYSQTYSLSGDFSSMGTNNLKLQTNGTTRLTVLGTNGFTGIGITPTEMLHVNGNVLGNQYSAVNGIYNSSIDLKLNILNATKLFIESTNGYVGIGTSLPSESIDVFGTARLRAVSGNNSLNQLLVVDASGKVFWRDVTSLTGTLSDIPFIMLKQSLGIGTGSLLNNSPANSSQGMGNTAVGYNAMQANAYGSYNTALGQDALKSNVWGADNTAIGASALYANDGIDNTAVGQAALYSNTTGYQNTAIGNGSLGTNTTGYMNTAIGWAAGPNSGALYNTTAIGWSATVTVSNRVRIGNSSVTSIGGQVGWSTFSDGRFKTEIKEDVSGLEFINLLRPVSYSFDQNSIDDFLGVPDSLRIHQSNGRSITSRQTGFIAQEVEEIVNKTGYVFHGVEAPQNDKDHYSIRYGEFVVPLVKAVQELSAKVEQQQKEINALRSKTNNNSDESSDEVVLHQNKPNPFVSGTEIMMNIPKRIVHAELIIYDMTGKQLEKRVITGRGSVSSKITGGALSAGMYLYTLITDDDATETKRMILN